MIIPKTSLSKFKNQGSLLAIIFVLILVMWINFKTTPWNKEHQVIASDVCQYYSYLPAIFIYDDIKLTFLKKDHSLLGPNFYPSPSPIGVFGIISTYGVGLLYSPFFFAAHAYALMSDYPANGLSVPYKFMLQWSSWFYLWMALLLMRKLLKKYFADRVVALVIITTVISTNLLWYVTGEAAMSHLFSFFLITAYLFLVDRWLEKPTAKNTILLGLTAGLISLIRPTNAIIGILPILWKITNWQELKTRFAFFLKNANLILLMLAMALLIWLPQMYYWKIISGSWLYYSYPDNQGFFFNNPQLFNNLFSWRKGWLIYLPVMGLMLVGIGLLYKVKKQFFWPLLLYFLLAWYVLSSWWSWWYGGGFSIRPYVDSLGIFSFGLAGFLTWTFKQRLALKIILFAVFAITFWNGAHNNARFANHSIHFDSNTKSTYLDGFFHIKMQPGFYKTLEKPDYNMARKGIYRIEGKEADSSGN